MALALHLNSEAVVQYLSCVVNFHRYPLKSRRWWHAAELINQPGRANNAGTPVISNRSASKAETLGRIGGPHFGRNSSHN